eukprot:scaffold1070_cov245-Pinguiococcus_pyrenoidosus.AAC.15
MRRALKASASVLARLLSAARPPSASIERSPRPSSAGVEWRLGCTSDAAVTMFATARRKVWLSPGRAKPITISCGPPVEPSTVRVTKLFVSLPDMP